MRISTILDHIDDAHMALAGDQLVFKKQVKLMNAFIKTETPRAEFDEEK